MRLSPDICDLVFRALFCLIFIGLGMEHLVSDQLLQHLMPAWVPEKRLISMACGLWLVGWGSLILLGWRVRMAAWALGAFLVGVTALVHLPGILAYSAQVPAECEWTWQILQRSNLVKNLCLLGVCFHLLHHQVGRYSLEHYLEPVSVSPPSGLRPPGP